MDKITKLPWKADGIDICQANNGHFHVIANVKLFRDYDADDIRNKQSAPDEHQLLVEMNCPIEGDEKANAEYICRAVNHFRAYSYFYDAIAKLYLETLTNLAKARYPDKLKNRDFRLELRKRAKHLATTNIETLASHYEVQS